MARHRPDRRRVKLHRNYTFEEAARTVGASRATVRRWVASGLPALRDRKPFLILGHDLADFLAARARPKTTCPPGMCFCVRCREARAPAGGIADFIPINMTSGNLRALCPECGSLMHRRTSMAQLQAIRAILDVAIVDCQPRLNDSAKLSADEHFGKEGTCYA